MAGYTAVRYVPDKFPMSLPNLSWWTYRRRDLGTEGALDADLALRKCLSGPNPIAVGPRYFTANRAIVATGSYGESCHEIATRINMSSSVA